MSSSNDPEIELLRKILGSGEFEPFIRYIRFPFFKNLEVDTQINFDFPITAIVGPNGTNKSTILRALYGSPGDNSLGTYWFSTRLNPIKSTSENRPCFIYGYCNLYVDKIVEVLKTRIAKKTKGNTDPDYWEPSRPIQKYGMEPMPNAEENMRGRSTTRWDPIGKNVIYLDFRSEISAHDKFFHHVDDSGSMSLRRKKDFIRKRSGTLRQIIEKGIQKFSYYNNEKISGINRALSLKEIRAVSEILDREYSEIRMIEHTFFNTKGKSVLIKTKNLDYSEAFAGSGEFAIVLLVAGILTAEPKSLVLLDEPETSLHPGAQKRLMKFLMKQAKEKKHQIVLSTHSPTLIEDLPEEAIKVLAISSTGRVSLQSQKTLPGEAFYYLGETSRSKKTILVEDELSKYFIEWVLLSEEAIRSQIDIIVLPGGASSLWQHLVGVATEGRKDILALMDGDQRPSGRIPEKSEIEIAQDSTLNNIIKELTNSGALRFSIDGGLNGGNSNQKKDLMRKYLLWVREFVDYLPGSSAPEDFILSNMKKDDKEKKILDNGELDAKEKFVHLTRVRLGIPEGTNPTSSEILTIERTCMTTIDTGTEECKQIRIRIRRFLS